MNFSPTVSIEFVPLVIGIELLLKSISLFELELLEDGYVGCACPEVQCLGSLWNYLLLLQVLMSWKAFVEDNDNLKKSLSRGILGILVCSSLTAGKHALLENLCEQVYFCCSLQTQVQSSAWRHSSGCAPHGPSVIGCPHTLMMGEWKAWTRCQV